MVPITQSHCCFSFVIDLYVFPIYYLVKDHHVMDWMLQLQISFFLCSCCYWLAVMINRQTSSEVMLSLEILFLETVN